MGDSLLKLHSNTHHQKLLPEPTMLRRPWPPMYRGPPPAVPLAAPNTRNSYSFRLPPDTADWRDYNNYSIYTNSTNSTAYSSPGYQSSKGRDYYFLAPPYYRSAMPPPPNMTSNGSTRNGGSDRLLMVDPAASRRRHTSSKKNGNGDIKILTKQITCHCNISNTKSRSRSMDDIRSDVVEVNSEWDDHHDENGNNILSSKNNEKKLSTSSHGSNKYGNGKLRENMYARRSVENLLVDTNYSPPPLKTHLNGRSNGKRNGYLKVLLINLILFLIT